MTRQEQCDKHKGYIEAENLNKLIDFFENVDYKAGVFDAVGGKLKIPFPPEPDDLVRLHKLIRQRKSFTVLEFGGGIQQLLWLTLCKKIKRTGKLC